MKHASILDTIGKTPIVRLNNIAPPHVKLYAKIESFNPMGSIKDRFAHAVIEQAEASGALKPGQTVVEATSGNTGIGLAMVCAQKNYPLVIVMAENFSIERRRLMRFLGAKVVLTPAAEKGSGMLAKAIELAQTHDWFLPRQFENQVNADIHSRTTAREILADFEGERLDYWVSTYGTGGTANGVARVLKAEWPHTRIVLVEPDNAPMLSGGLPQPAPSGPVPVSHPAFRPHPIQGTAPDFIPRLTQDVLDRKEIDQIVPVNGADALELARSLAQREGVFAGISAGAALAGAMQVARSAPEGASILCMLPDTGERYLSTPLFDNVEAGMNAEEEEISRSTPLCRFDAPACPAPATAAAAPADEVAVDAEAEALTAQAIAADGKVVMFALEWCEFCWAVRKLLNAMDVPFESIDLDSVRYQQNDLGGRIRAALRQRTGMATIPQIFLSGEHLGGASDVINAAADGSLALKLQAAGVSPRAIAEPRSYLPKWVA